MSWMVYSFGNRYSWCGQIELYVHMETILSSYNYKLKYIESYGGTFFDYFGTTHEYEKKKSVKRLRRRWIINSSTRKSRGELIDLNRVFKGGRVIMGQATKRGERLTS